ncbi:hypothetical protein [Xenorhabdus innexi]|uniref:Uncharacterized protein n=1 Tax=Xenorhabdus innexi TaxID=290109 RepID=A0A1N6N0T4_9GAMM|nr:hypothetical protein [Xenorhabdus innexi]PHM28325.1 hypothetical protein Xinn_03852 [Xenorhabdus innexi]SIP74675.1 hypothetical protein XIS1_760006 [Xenorhabdus innexi]
MKELKIKDIECVSGGSLDYDTILLEPVGECISVNPEKDSNLCRTSNGMFYFRQDDGSYLLLSPVPM